MAESIARTPGIAVFVVAGANVATQVNFPNTTRRATVYFETDAGKVAVDGTDAAAISAAHNVVAADQFFEMFIDRDPVEGGKGPASIYVATAAGGTTVRVTAEAG